MATKEKQIKNSFIYLLQEFICIILPFLALSIFTRILSINDYGILALANVYAVFVSGLANFGMITIYQRNFFEYEGTEKESELFYSTLLFVIVTFFISVVLTHLFKVPLARWIVGSSDYADIIFWATCSYAFGSLNAYYLTYMKSSENARSFAFYRIFEMVIGICLSLYFVAYMRTGIIGLIWGQLLSHLAILVMMALNMLKLLPLSFNREVLKYSLKLAYPLTPTVVVKVAATQFDKYMIGLLGSVGGVGIYSIGQRISYIVFTFMTAIQNVFLPQVYKMMFHSGSKELGKYLTSFAYLSIAVALSISICSEEIIFFLTPKSYHGAADIIIVLSMFYGSMFFGKQPQLIYAKRTYVSSLLGIFSIILNVGLNIPFIMKWGAMGAAWATFIAGMISGGISFVISQHYYEIKWEYKKIGAIFFIFFTSAILMILMRHFSVAYGFRLILKCASVCSYVYLGIKFKIITMGNYTLIRNMIHLRKVVTSDYT